MIKNRSIDLSQQLLLASRKEQALEDGLKQLKSLSPQELLADLTDDVHKLTFWINCYNTLIQTQLRAQGTQASTGGAFFTQRSLLIAGQKLSFDDIEHGIIRGGRAKYGLGFLPSLWNSKFIKQQRVQKPDWRIHFALNCGAKSCPPIAFYTPAQLEADLEMATQAYLSQETEYDATANTVHVSKLMLWFMGDFGGKKGIRRILEKYGLILKNSQPKIKFKAYSWDIVIDSYRSNIEEWQG